MNSSKFLRQTTLATSGDQNLVIDKSHRYVKQCSNARILCLPDELLCDILELSCSPERYAKRCLAEYCNARTLMLVCQRFHLIARPILYRNIQSAYRTELVPSSQAVRQLHRSLSENQSLRAHCRDLKVHVPDIGAGPSRTDSSRIANDIVSWCTNVRVFSMWGGFDKDPIGTWALIGRAIESMSYLEQLHLSRESWNLCVERLFDIPESPRLATMCIHGISKSQRSSNNDSDFRASRV